MPSSTPVRYAVVGLGHIAQVAVLPAFAHARRNSELVAVVSEVVGYDGEIAWDRSKPDGTPRKLLDVSKLRALGWQPRIRLRDGIASVYQWYQSNLVAAAA